MLGVIDTVPRARPSDAELDCLQNLARRVVDQLEGGRPSVNWRSSAGS
jgi:hypothetical protein